MAARTLDQMKSPTRKLLTFFKSSRDKWKEKCLVSKKQLVILGNQVRAVEKSREEWRKRAKTAERQLAELMQAKKK